MTSDGWTLVAAHSFETVFPQWRLQNGRQTKYPSFAYTQNGEAYRVETSEGFFCDDTRYDLGLVKLANYQDDQPNNILFSLHTEHDCGFMHTFYEQRKIVRKMNFISRKKHAYVKAAKADVFMGTYSRAGESGSPVLCKEGGLLALIQEEWECKPPLNTGVNSFVIKKFLFQSERYLVD